MLNGGLFQYGTLMGYTFALLLVLLVALYLVILPTLAILGGWRASDTLLRDFFGVEPEATCPGQGQEEAAGDADPDFW